MSHLANKLLHATIRPNMLMAGQDDTAVLMGSTIHVSPRRYDLIHGAGAKLLWEMLGSLTVLDLSEYGLR